MYNLIKDRGIATLYVQHSVIKRKDNAIELCCKDGVVRVPIEQISLLQLGCGTSITYSAVSLLTQHKVTIQWCRQEHKMFCYATENRKSDNLLKQCRLYADIKSRTDIAISMFKKRFGFSPDTSIDALRGMEGIRVKKAYQNLADKYGISWNGRHYTPGKFEDSDLPNQMITLANQIMYGVCNSVIVQLGLSPAIGFVHTGYMLSFVYDIADLYKTNIAIDVAFETASYLSGDSKSLLVKLINEKMHKENMNKKMVNDIKELLQL